MRLGIDSYSLRWQGWNAFQFIDYAASVGVDNHSAAERGRTRLRLGGKLRRTKKRKNRQEKCKKSSGQGGAGWPGARCHRIDIT